MINTISLISPDEIKKQYWEQYRMLTNARNETMALLRAFGVSDFPDSFEDKAAPSNPPAIITRAPEGSRKSQNALVRESAAHIRKGITRQGIIDYIKMNYSGRNPDPDSISALISAIKKEDGWIEVEKGIGGRPSVYDLPD